MQQQWSLVASRSQVTLVQVSEEEGKRKTENETTLRIEYKVIIMIIK